MSIFFFQAEDGIRDVAVTGVQTCALPISADRIATLEVGGAGSTAWVHGGGFGTYHRARDERMARLDELRRRWDEQHVKLKDLVATLKVKATANDSFTSRYRAAQTRLRKFEEAG